MQGTKRVNKVRMLHLNRKIMRTFRLGRHSAVWSCLIFGIIVILTLYACVLSGQNIVLVLHNKAVPKDVDKPVQHQPSNVSGDDTLTVVTAFFDIGRFGKGLPFNTRSMDTYLKWAVTFKYLMNPLIVYTDSLKFLNEMKMLRSGLMNKTKVLFLDRNSSWAFASLNKIQEIYSTKGYPKFHPNTVVPEYACAVHARYEVISRAASENYFNTDYYAWIDIGFFRDIIHERKIFSLLLPPEFNDSRIAVNKVYNTSMNLDISRIIKEKRDWIGGGILVGRLDLVLKFTKQYKRIFDWFLSRNLMNSEQQLLYATYSNAGRKELKPEVELQLYMAPKGDLHDPWFYLGYIMRKLQ